MKSQVLHTVWCNVSGEIAGEIWHWSLLGAKGLSTRAGDDDGNAGETIKLTAVDSKQKVHVRCTWSRGRRASRATLIASLLFCWQDVGIILRNYHSRSPAVRDDESNSTLAETEEIWAKLRIGRVANAKYGNSFPGSSRCRRRSSLLKRPTVAKAQGIAFLPCDHALNSSQRFLHKMTNSRAVLIARLHAR